MKKEIVLCDRCGAEVEYPLITEYRIKKVSSNHGESYCDEIDLCQNCIDSFEIWFNKPESVEE